MAFLWILVAIWIASSFGQTLLRPLKVFRESPLERFVFACAVGLGVISYGVYGLGWIGLLSPLPVGLWWGAGALIGIPGMRVQAIELRNAWTALTRSFGAKQPWDFDRIVRTASIAVLLLMGFLAAVACYRPPGAIEWDAIAYHLADPKIFLGQHRITLLPTEHHSNFPFTMETLFAVGLMFGDYPLANLFHLTTAVLTVLALIGFGRRVLTPNAGYLAAVLYATTPLVFWEASVAYIDLAAALYATLSLFACLSAIQERSAPAEGQAGENGWMLLAGLTMGFALGTKYLALIPFALTGLLLIARRVPIRQVVFYALVALLIGSPWYLKNAVLMRNPVYPFYFHAFPQSRYWSEDREISYRSEQGSFGYPHALGQPNVAIRSLMEAPWRILVDSSRYYNQGEYTFSALIGGVYAALCMPLLLFRRRPWVVRDLGLLVVAQLLAWFFLAQIGRYLLQFIPLAALLAGYSADRLLTGEDAGLFGKALAGLLPAGQTAYVLWSFTFLPTGGTEAAEFKMRTGLEPTALSLPADFAYLSSPEKREEALHRHLDNYDAFQWINRNTHPNDGVVLYEDTRGFYLDRPYLWGNGEHSSYIPYSRMADAAAMTNWFNSHGCRYAVINLNWSPQNVHHAPISSEEAPDRLNAWYAGAPGAAPRIGSWRDLVSAVLRQKLWTVVDVEHGNVILQIGGPKTADAESNKN